jgi:hypothetical protein
MSSNVPQFLSSLTLKKDADTVSSRFQTNGLGSMTIIADNHLYLQSENLWVYNHINNNGSMRKFKDFYNDLVTGAETFATTAVSDHDTAIRTHIDQKIQFSESVMINQHIQTALIGNTITQRDITNTDIATAKSEAITAAETFTTDAVSDHDTTIREHIQSQIQGATDYIGAVAIPNKISANNLTERTATDAAISTAVQDSYELLTSETAALIESAKNQAVQQANMDGQTSIENNNVTERAATNQAIDIAINSIAASTSTDLAALQARVQDLENLINAMNAE